MNKSKYDLTQGSVWHQLLRLSIPAMGSQMMQILYNVTDMFWLGRLGSGAVAASGAVTAFMWMAITFQSFGSRGTEIGVSQNLGRGDAPTARGYLQSALMLALGLGLFYAGILIFGPERLIGFYKIQDPAVVRNAVLYMIILGVGLPFQFVNSVLSAAFNASGNSAKPFYINLICLIINAVLDPVLIFVVGWGVAGAAVCTALGQMLACALMIRAFRRYRHEAFWHMPLWKLPQTEHLRQILRWATPVALQNFLFTFMIILVSRFVAAFGTDAMAVQRVGSQVDSLAYLASAGFSAALAAFVGQNYGARRWGRIRQGFWVSTALMGAWGLMTTAIIFGGQRFFFHLFLPGETAVIEMGAAYLRLLSYCQVAGCLEGVGLGLNYGLGQTGLPSVIGVLTSILRVVLVVLLSRSSLGVDGIWLALAISYFLRGLGMYLAGILGVRIFLKTT